MIFENGEKDPVSYRPDPLRPLRVVNDIRFIYSKKLHDTSTIPIVHDTNKLTPFEREKKKCRPMVHLGRFQA